MTSIPKPVTRRQSDRKMKEKLEAEREKLEAEREKLEAEREKLEAENEDLPWELLDVQRRYPKRNVKRVDYSKVEAAADILETDENQHLVCKAEFWNLCTVKFRM